MKYLEVTTSEKLMEFSSTIWQFFSVWITQKMAYEQEVHGARLAYCSKFLNTPVELVTRRNVPSIICTMENTKIGFLTKMLFLVKRLSLTLHTWSPHKGRKYLNQPAGLFKYVWPVSGHQMLKVNVIEEYDNFNSFFPCFTI